MVEYTKINCKLTNVQLNKLKKAVKSNEGATLRLGIKNFNKDELPHELLLITRQNTKLRNAINNNLATDKKLSKTQIKKLIQAGGFLGKLAGPLMKVALPLAKNVLAPLGLQLQCWQLKRTIKLLKEYLRMNNLNAIELTDSTANKNRLDEINKIRDYFNNEIKERKDITKKLNKYLVSFDYLDKIFIALSASFGTLSIPSYALVVGTPAGIAGSSLTLIFTIGTGISKSLLKVTKKRKKKHNKIIALAKNKLNTIDTLLSSALNDSEISHEEFTNIITETNIYENIKENIKELTTESSEEEKSTTL